MEENFGFVSNILKENIGNIVDDFYATNKGQLVTKYNGQMLILMIIEAMKKAEKEIINNFNFNKESNYEKSIEEKDNNK